MEEISPERMDEMAEQLIRSGAKKIEAGRAEIAEGEAYKNAAMLTRQRLKGNPKSLTSLSHRRKLAIALVKMGQARLRERDAALVDIFRMSGKNHLSREELHHAYLNRTGDTISPANLASYLSKSSLFKSFGYNQWGLASAENANSPTGSEESKS